MSKADKVDIWMLAGVLGEERDDAGELIALPNETKQTVRAGFGAEIIASGRAELYAKQDKRGKPASE